MSQRDEILNSVYNCVRSKLKEKKVFLYLSSIFGGEDEVKLEVYNYVEDKIEPIIQLIGRISDDYYMYKTLHVALGFANIMYSYAAALFAATGEESMFNTEADLFKDMFEACYGVSEGESSKELLSKSAKCDYNRLAETASSLLTITMDLCIHNYVVNYIESNYPLLQLFISDFESAAKMSGRPRTKVAKADAYFKRVYGITYEQAASIYNNLYNPPILYDVMTKIMEKKLKKVEAEMVKKKLESKEIPKQQEIVLKKFGEEYVQYCSERWIELKVEERKKVLKALQEKYPKHYTDEKINEELNDYRIYLKRLCENYKKRRL